MARIQRHMHLVLRSGSHQLVCSLFSDLKVRVCQELIGVSSSAKCTPGFPVSFPSPIIQSSLCYNFGSWSHGYQYPIPVDQVSTNGLSPSSSYSELSRQCATRYQIKFRIMTHYPYLNWQVWHARVHLQQSFGIPLLWIPCCHPFICSIARLAIDFTIHYLYSSVS